MRCQFLLESFLPFMFNFLEGMIYTLRPGQPLKIRRVFKFLRFFSKIGLEEFVDLCSKKPERFSSGKTFQLPLYYSYSSVCSEMFQQAQNVYAHRRFFFFSRIVLPYNILQSVVSKNVVSISDTSVISIGFLNKTFYIFLVHEYNHKIHFQWFISINNLTSQLHLISLHPVCY